MTCLPRPVMKTNCSIPASRASSTAYWMTGLSTTGSISLGMALVAGRNRVPMPATGKTAFRTGFAVVMLFRGMVLKHPVSSHRPAIIVQFQAFDGNHGQADGGLYFGGFGLGGVRDGLERAFHAGADRGSADRIG